MKIYIVISGEDSEGGSIQGVFTDRAAALDKLDYVTSSPHFLRCDWAKMLCYDGNDRELELISGEIIERHG